MATTSPLRQRMIEDMTIRNLSQATQQSYIYAVRKFSLHFGRSPDRLGIEDIRAYQLHLIAQKRSWSHINQTACALRFFLASRWVGRRRSSASSPAASRKSSRPFCHPRRLAAMAQAALIARCVSRAGGDASGFVKWASHSRSQMFLLQCFVDLRQEPRWAAEFIFPDQLRSEFGGRILTTANVHAAAVNSAGWQGLLLDDSEGSLRRQLDLGRAFLPGPLEGGSAAVVHIPETYLTEIREDLSASRITTPSFSALANASLLFHIRQTSPSLPPPPLLAPITASSWRTARHRFCRF